MKPGTPLPWFVRVNSDGQAIVRTAYDQEGDRFPIQAPYGAENGKRDVEYVVAACNAYPRLVEALRETVRQYENVRAAEHYPSSESTTTKEAKDLLRELGEL